MHWQLQSKAEDAWLLSCCRRSCSCLSACHRNSCPSFSPILFVDELSRRMRDQLHIHAEAQFCNFGQVHMSVSLMWDCGDFLCVRPPSNSSSEFLRAVVGGRPISQRIPICRRNSSGEGPELIFAMACLTCSCTDSVTVLGSGRASSVSSLTASLAFGTVVPTVAALVDLAPVPLPLLRLLDGSRGILPWSVAGG